MDHPIDQVKQIQVLETEHSHRSSLDDAEVLKQVLETMKFFN